MPRIEGKALTVREEHDLAYRDFDFAFSRRALLRGGALLGAGAALSGAPALFAQDKAAASNSAPRRSAFPLSLCQSRSPMLRFW